MEQSTRKLPLIQKSKPHDAEAVDVTRFTRCVRLFSQFFNRPMAVFVAQADPLRRILYKAVDVAPLMQCSRFMLAMYLQRKRVMRTDGIFQAKGCGHHGAVRKNSYFISLSVCKQLAAHVKNQAAKTGLRPFGHAAGSDAVAAVASKPIVAIPAVIPASVQATAVISSLIKDRSESELHKLAEIVTRPHSDLTHNKLRPPYSTTPFPASSASGYPTSRGKRKSPIEESEGDHLRRSVKRGRYVSMNLGRKGLNATA